LVPFRLWAHRAIQSHKGDATHAMKIKKIKEPKENSNHTFLLNPIKMKRCEKILKNKPNATRCKSKQKKQPQRPQNPKDSRKEQKEQRTLVFV